MDKKLSVITEIKSKQNKEVVDTLTNFLKEAEKGEVIGVAGIVYSKGGDIKWFIEGSAADDLFKTIGILESFKCDMISQMSVYFEDTEPPSTGT